MQRRGVSAARRVAALLLAALAGCAPADPAHPASAGPAPLPPPDAARLAAAESLLLDAVDPRRMPGLSAVVLHGEVALLRIGAGALRAGAPATPTPETVFPIGSLTKMFTAMALLRLVETGHLALDHPVGRWIDGLPPGWEGVTLLHLLTHTAGLERDAPPGALPGRMSAPGSAYLYSNAGYVMLGRVIERAAGSPFVTYLREEILEPARLGAIGACPEELDVTGHRWTPMGLVPAARGGEDAAGAGGLCASAAALARVPRLLAAGHLVSAASVARMTTPGRLTSGEGTGYGMGLSLGEDGSFQHSGAVDGFTSHLRHHPATGLTIVILTNGETARPAQLGEAVERVLRGAAPSTP